MDFTRHGEARTQQRALPSLVVMVIADYGVSLRRHGADVYFLDKAARRDIRRAVGGSRNMRTIEPWLNAYIVIADDGKIITTARRTRRMRRQ